MILTENTISCFVTFSKWVRPVIFYQKALKVTEALLGAGWFQFESLLRERSERTQVLQLQELFIVDVVRVFNTTASRLTTQLVIY